MAANGLHPAAIAPNRVALGGAPLDHPKVAKGEIIARGIVGIENPKRVRDLLGRIPVGGSAVGEAYVACEFVNVDIGWHHETVRAEITPEAQVHAVCWANHPTKEEHHALVRALGLRSREDVFRAVRSTKRESTQLPNFTGKQLEGVQKIMFVRMNVGGEACPKGAVLSLNAARTHEHRDEVTA